MQVTRAFEIFGFLHHGVEIPPKKWLPGPHARIINQTDDEKLKKKTNRKTPTKQQLVFTHQSLDAHTVEQKAIFFPLRPTTA